MAWQTHPPLLYRTHEPPGARNRQSPAIEIHAKHSTVLRTPLANPSIPCPQKTHGLLPTDPVFHWTLPEPPGPQVRIQPPHGWAGEYGRRGARPALRTPIAGTTDTRAVCEGGPRAGYDHLLWGTSISFDGPVRGGVRAAPFVRMQKDIGDIEVVPDRSIW